MPELTRRIAFGVPAAIVAFAIILAGGAWLAALLAVAAAIAAWEFYRIARTAGHTPLTDAGCALAGLVPLAVHAQYLDLVQPRFAYLATVMIFIMSVVIWTRGVEGKPTSAVATTVFGVLYTGGLLSFAYAIRYHDYAAGALQIRGLWLSAGGVLLGLPVIVTWGTDIGAYAVGRLVGGHKLIPVVSPGKTVSGAIGGLVISVLVTWLYVQFVLRPVAQLTMTTAATLVFGVTISVAAQLGDIFESLLKREAGVKDSSSLLPGHGGMLDRLDGLLFVLPTAHLILRWLLQPAPR